MPDVRYLKRSMVRFALLAAVVVGLTGSSNVCLDQPCAPANIVADFVFLIDRSNALTKDQFEDVRQFLSTFTGSLKVDPKGAQVAFYTYGSTATSSGLLKSLNQPAQVSDAIAKLAYEGEVERNLDRAFALEDAEVTAANGLRADAEKILVVIVADAWSGSNIFTSAELETARSKFDGIYVIGIGMQATDNAFSEIRRLAGVDSNVYFAFHTRQLPYVGLWLSKISCPGYQGPTDPPTPATTMPTPKPSIGCKLQGLDMDIFLVVDTSSSMPVADFTALKQSIYDFVSVFPFGKGQTQFGLVTVYADSALYYTGINVDTYERGQLLKTVEDLQQERADGQTLKLALQGIESKYLKSGVSTASKKLILYWTGNTNFDVDPTNQLESMEKAYGMHTLSVQWNDGAVQKTLANLVGGLRCVLQATPDYRSSVASLLEQQICLSSYCR